ncbi:MAG: pyridoxal-phosphate dependent enzyme, partial [Phycisphaerales bacterium]|nr:pyridoxal-phosphate dependent enzyme [Phycisphaerales bacterium]
PEIWRDTEGKIDCLVGGIGTGGTISGAGKYLKEAAAKAGRESRIVCPDPRGSIYHDMFHHGTQPEPSIYRVEGIGHDFMVGTLDFSVIDDVREIDDRDSFITARRLCREEGIFSGGSTGTAVFGALQVARELGPGKIVVVIICDSGDRYLSKCFNDEWMKDMGYLAHKSMFGTVREIVAAKGRNDVEFAVQDDTLVSVVRRMGELGISQMPIRPSNGGSYLMIHESDILQGLLTGACSPDDSISRLAKPLQGQVSIDAPLARVQDVFDQNNVAVVMDNDAITTVLSKIDLVEYLAART